MAAISDDERIDDTPTAPDGVPILPDRASIRVDSARASAPPTVHDDRDSAIEEPRLPPVRPRRNTRSQHATGARPPKRRSARCNECIARGPSSRCDRAWPSCSQCVAHDTTSGCFRAAEERDAAISAHYAAHSDGLRRRNQRAVERATPERSPSPTPAPASPTPPSPAPSAGTRYSPAPSTIRSQRSHVTISSGSRSRITSAPSHSSSNRVSAPTAGGGVGRHRASAADIAAAREELARAQAMVQALEEGSPGAPPPGLPRLASARRGVTHTHTRTAFRALHNLTRMPIHGFFARYTHAVLSRTPPPPRLIFSLLHTRILTIRSLVLPYRAVPASAPFRGLNVGLLGGSQQPRAPVAIGVIAQAEFSFVAQNVVDLFVKKNRTTHISLVYLTDAYNKQSSLHLTTTTYKTQIDIATGESILVAQPLPDLNERGMSFLDWSRAFQRFEAILDAIDSPLAPRWALHGHFIRHHPVITTNWPLALLYDIRVRRRAVTDHSLDMGIFQPLIWESCRSEQQEERFESLSRSLGHTLPAPRAPAGTVIRAVTPQGPLPPTPGPWGPVPRAGQASRRDTTRCFACGNMGHVPNSCNRPPKLISKGVDGKWVLKGPTSAPSAGSLATGHKHAKADPRVVVTPLLADAWELLLAEAGVLPEFADLPVGLRSGFHLGISTAPLLSVIIHPNHKSATDRPEVISKNIAKEIEAGRYSGPFSPSALHSLIGNFRASPLGVVDKPSSPGDFRIIQDFSFPHDDPIVPSVNSEIDVSDFPCLWGSFPDVVRTILALPPGSQAATFDVDAAYRRMPVLPADQIHTVVHWEGECWIDHCVPFGAASSCGIFGRVGDGLLHICNAKGLGPVLKWVDDFLFFRSPIPRVFPYAFTYSEQQIYELGELLGIPWKLAKTMLFAPLFRYIGFDWDIPSRRVSIPHEKRKKFISKLQAWLGSDRVTLKATESILGSLIHCALAMPLGRSRVAGIAKFTATFSHSYRDRFTAKTPPERAIQDAAWWLEELSHGNCSSTLRNPPPKSSIQCYMDASTSFGIGIMMDAEHGIWRLRKGWKSAGRDIGWAEIVAVELTLEALIQKGVRDASITLFSDNQGVIGALRAGRSRNDQQNCVLQRIMARALDHNLWLDFEYIATDRNPADKPSRGTPPPGSTKLTLAPELDYSAGKWLIWV